MINLKEILMVLGNRLVTERKYFPSSVGENEGLVSTRPITAFTNWINETPDAQQILSELGFIWPTISRFQKSKLKPLEWSGDESHQQAYTRFGNYLIGKAPDNCPHKWDWNFYEAAVDPIDYEEVKYCDSIEHGKKLAEEHYRKIVEDLFANG